MPAYCTIANKTPTIASAEEKRITVRIRLLARFLASAGMESPAVVGRLLPEFP